MIMCSYLLMLLLKLKISATMKEIHLKEWEL